MNETRHDAFIGTTETARLLGIGLATLYRRLKEMGAKEGGEEEA
uniref:DNA binding HTH domain-containing protein n=1 Tax=Desulfobacca acetoxidans TaxID=60893 RepID=A0A7V4G8I9_9BACT